MRAHITSQSHRYCGTVFSSTTVSVGCDDTRSGDASSIPSSRLDCQPTSGRKWPSVGFNLFFMFFFLWIIATRNIELGFLTSVWPASSKRTSGYSVTKGGKEYSFCWEKEALNLMEMLLVRYAILSMRWTVAGSNQNCVIFYFFCQWVRPSAEVYSQTRSVWAYKWTTMCTLLQKIPTFHLPTWDVP